MRESTVSGRGAVKFFNRRTSHLMMAAAIAGIGASSAMAVSTYTGPSGTTSAPVTGDWNTANNWSPNGVPTSSTTTELDFLGTTAYASTDDLAGTFNLNILKVNGNGSSIAANGSGSALNFSGTNPVFNQLAASVFTVSAPVSLGTNTAINQVAGGEIDLTGNVSGSNSLTLSNSTGSGNSIVKLSGSNSFNGLVVNPFVTAVSPLTSNTTTLGSGLVTLSGGTLSLLGQQSASGSPVEQTMGVTGFSGDVIPDINAVASASHHLTNSSTGTLLNGIDSSTNPGGNMIYVNGWNGNATGGLPANGTITSNFTNTLSGHTVFQLGYNGSGGTNYASNNTLYFRNTTAQSLSLATPSTATTLQFLAMAQNTVTFNVQLTFSDSSTDTYTSGISTGPWATFSSSSHAANNAIFGANSVSYNSTGSINGNFWWQMTESDITLTPTDAAKTITSIQFTPTSLNSGNTAEIYAVSGDVISAGTLLGSQTYANNLSVTANSSININGSLSTTMGNLAIGANTLSVASSNSSSSAYSLNLGSVSLTGSGSGATAFNVAASTGGGAGTLTLGALNDNSTAQTITINPTGTGSVVLGTNATSLVPGTVVNVDGGTLYSNTASSLGTTATVVLASPGTFVVGANQTISALNGSGGTASLGSNTLTVGSTDNLSSTFGGTITGTGYVSKAGTGSLTLSGASTFGGTTVNSNGSIIPTSVLLNNNAGSVIVAGPSVVNNFAGITSGPLGTNAVLVNAGSTGVFLTSAGPTLANPIYMTSSGSALSTLGGMNTTGVTTFSGNITLGTGSSGDYGHGLQVAATTGGEVDFTGNILQNFNAAGGATHPVIVNNLSGSGPAIVRFTGSNTYSGGTTVNPNVTLAAGPSAFTTTLGTGNVLLAGGTVALQGQLTPGSQQVVSLNGYNADTMLDNVATSGAHSSTGTPTSTIDGGSLFYETGYNASGGLPTSGTIVSASTGHTFQLAPYAGLNTLRFTAGSTTQSFNLSSPSAFQTLDFLATSQGAATYSVTLNFNNSTSDTIGSFSTSDWYGGHTGYNAIAGLMNVQQATGNVLAANDTMQEYDALLPVADQSKAISSVTITATSLGGTSGDVYAISGATAASSSPMSTQTYANNFSLSANSDIDVSGSLTASIGALTIGGQTLSVTSADNSGSPYSLTTGAVTFVGTAPTFYVGNSNGGGAGTLVLGSLNGGAAQNLSKTGPGTLILSQPATLLGEPSVYNVLGGTLASNDPNAMTYNNSGSYIYVGISVASGATFSIGASQQISQLNDSGSPAVNSSSVLLNGNTLTIGSAHNYNSTFSGVIGDGIGGSGSIITTGGGIVTLNGASTYSGTTTVGAFSTLVAANTTGSATGSSNVSLFASTTVTLVSATVGSIAGNVTAGSQSNIQPGGNGSIGSLTLGGLTTGFHTDLNFDLSGGTGPGVVTGNDLLTLGSGTVNIVANTLLTLGSLPSSIGADYRLIGGSISGITLSNLVLPTAPVGDAYSLSKTVDPGYIDLVVGSSGPTNLLWDNIGTGDNTTWDNGSGSTSQNWNNSGTASTFTSGNNVTFSDVNAGNYTVNLGSNVLPAAITVSSAGTYTIGSTGGFAIGDVPLGTTTLVQSGGGTLNITNVNTFTGATNISGSGTTLHLTDTGILATASVNVGAGAVANIDGLLSNSPTVVDSGTINLGASDVNNNPGATDPLARTFTSLSVGSGASLVIKPAATSSSRTVLVTSLASNLGKIDLSNNDMIIHNGNAGSVSTAGSIANQIATAYNGGTWTGTTGITSSSASSNRLTAIGYEPGGSTFDGISTTSTDILVKYTYYGDANLDGKVDGSDYSRIDSAYLAGNLTGWSNGDFNYDGVINGSDYTLIDNAFNSQGTQIAAEIASPLAQATDQIAGASSGSSAVPEPTSFGLLAMGAVGLLGRRRRQQGRN